MTVVGITGPTEAGKTTVLRVLASLGAVILDCDAVYHDLTLSCRPMRAELAGAFGPDIFGPDGALLRKKLGAVVFDDPRALERLNAITHRYVAQAVDQAVEGARREGRPAAAVDAIALIEGGLGSLCDVTVAVVASEETRVRRIMAREGIGEDYARLRVSAQKPAQYFEEQCDYVLRNDGDDPAELEARAWTLFDTIINKGDA